MHLHKIVLLCLPLLLFSTAADAKIVFGSQREGIDGIYVMDDDGSNQTLLTEDEDLKPFPDCWSPDGKQIVFTRLPRINARHLHIFLMNPDGTNIRQVFAGNHADDYIGKISFSPDGKNLVFDRIVRIDNKQKSNITVLNIETGKMKAIADISATFCDWSPDGKHIIFSRPLAVGGGGNTIWIMSADGHNPRPLIPLQDGAVIIRQMAPRWSPDGQKIVFLQHEYTWEPIPNLGIALIYKAHRYMTCDRNGENIRKLQIPKDWHGYGIDWMDDGNSVVFSAREGMPLNKPILHGFVFPPCYIYKYHIPTGERTQLTNDPGWDQTIDWISDDVLSVTPQGKKKVTWGAVKR